MVHNDPILLAKIIRQLAGAHEQRYKRFAVQGDLSSAITLSKQSLLLLPEDHLNYVAALCCVAQCIRTRFLYFGKTRELQQAASLAQECLERCPVGHPYRAAALENLVDTLYAQHQDLKDHPQDMDLTFVDRFGVNGDRDDLDSAINLVQDEITHHSSGSDLSLPLLELYSTAVSTRFYRYKELSDLGLCISAREDVLHHLPLGHPLRVQYLSMLTSAVHIRANKLNDAPSFAKLIPLYEELMRILPSEDKSRASTAATDFADALDSWEETFPGSADYTSLLCNLASALIRRFTLLSESSDQNRAITLYKDALTYLSGNDSLRLQCLLNAGLSVRSRYLSGRRPSDLDALAWFEEASHSEALDEDDTIAVFVGFSSVMLLRFRDAQFPTTAECDRLVEMGSETMDLCPEVHPDRASVCALYAQVLHNKFTVSWEPTYLDRAIPMYREAVSKFPHQQNDKTLLRTFCRFLTLTHF
ncbi:hypothetical protein EUX98_g7832 [Antrodiella citrinella]|uniref:Anaphase-promoting complex subunit 5 domain-containing protein n=1 Tax=Antrodiella citrinella TaxID=2447956 RepID=A0A4S4ML39_9APHY|nr:hypothetical protein EUX98_g7832 [Antrodiella citrinella]